MTEVKGPGGLNSTPFKESGQFPDESVKIEGEQCRRPDVLGISGIKEIP